MYTRLVVSRTVHFLLMTIMPMVVAAHGLHLMVFTKTAGFRHDVIPDGIAMFQKLAIERGAEIVFTEDDAMFNDDTLRAFHAVVFLNSTGDLLTPTEQASFERYIRAGGGYVGIHAASDAEYAWTWYGGLVGSYFQSHPQMQTAEILVEDHVHSSTKFLPRRWSHWDEWYDFRSNPRGNVHVLLSVNTKSYSGSTMGYDHPVSWCHAYDGGRSWYTALGHSRESYTEQNFIDHVWNGILWAAGRDSSDATASIPSTFVRNIVANELRQPMQVVAVDDTTLLVLERNGVIFRFDVNTGATTLVGDYRMKLDGEYGALGMELAKDFATSRRFFIYLADIERSQLRLLSSVMTPTGVDRAFDDVILEYPFNADECCHAAGDIAHGTDGSIFLSLGDNTNPFESSGYAPVDTAIGRAYYDAQRTSGNTNDLRGKILHIIPKRGGGYDIPPGNLFPVGTDSTRPEIFCMGVRNPFRISYDTITKTLYWGDVGPDAFGSSSVYGSRGYDELNRTTTAGNFGWPFLIGNNQPYSVNGVWSDPMRCVNRSPNNKGKRILPPAMSPIIWYGYATASGSDDVGEGGRCVLAGPVIHTDPTKWASPFTSYFENTILVYDYVRCWIKAVHLDEEGRVLKVVPVFHDPDSTGMIDMCTTPNGTVYILGWRERTGSLRNAVLFALQRSSTGLAVQATIKASAVDGPAPLTVEVDGRASTGDSLTYAWDLNDDGMDDATTPTCTQTFTEPGIHRVTLTVTSGVRTSRASIRINVGNTHPTVTIIRPRNGSVVDLDAPVPYQASVTDPEDGTLSGSNVVAQISLGHDDHAHPMSTTTGAVGMLIPEQVSGHGNDANVYGLLTVSATDHGAPLTASIETTASVILQPRRKQAEFTTFDPAAIDVILCDDVGGGRAISSLQNLDAFSISPLSLENVASITIRYTADWGGILAVRKDGPFGPEAAFIYLPKTTDGVKWRSVTADVTNAEACSTYYFVALRSDTPTGLFTINWIEFEMAGSNVPQSVSHDAALTLAPNPATSNVRVSTSQESSITHVSIYSMIGERVLSMDGSQRSLQDVSTAALMSGTYIVVIDTETGRHSSLLSVTR